MDSIYQLDATLPSAANGASEGSWQRPPHSVRGSRSHPPLTWHMYGSCTIMQVQYDLAGCCMLSQNWGGSTCQPKLQFIPQLLSLPPSLSRGCSPQICMWGFSRLLLLAQEIAQSCHHPQLAMAACCLPTSSGGPRPPGRGGGTIRVGER